MKQLNLGRPTGHHSRRMFTVVMPKELIRIEEGETCLVKYASKKVDNFIAQLSQVKVLRLDQIDNALAKKCLGPQSSRRWDRRRCRWVKGTRSPTKADLTKEIMRRCKSKSSMWSGKSTRVAILSLKRIGELQNSP